MIIVAAFALNVAHPGPVFDRELLHDSEFAEVIEVTAPKVNY
jgi:F420-dependent methylenetetrahydromethanopterin dehydrogenase